MRAILRNLSEAFGVFGSIFSTAQITLRAKNVCTAAIQVALLVDIRAAWQTVLTEKGAGSKGPVRYKSAFQEGRLAVRSKFELVPKKKRLNHSG